MTETDSHSWQSRFAKRYAGGSGIEELMDDLGRAMSDGDKLMLGGGNPAGIPQVNELWKARLSALANDGDELNRALVFYDTPQGHRRFIDAMVEFLNREFTFDIGPENIAVTNGSQNALFYLLNLLGGTSASGARRRILFPLVPEYIGYADQHLEPGTLLSKRPLIEEMGDHRFKYHIDFDALNAITDPLGAVCVSRPTNPTGNVLTDGEIERLRRFCRERDIPLIIDNAYGAPFPHILFKDVSPVWDENIILSMSLSKMGLPATRTGIVIAKQSIIKQMTSVNAILGLSTGSLGQIIAYPMLQDSTLLRVSKEIVQPYYYQKSIQAQKWFDQSLAGLPYRLHVSEGALFLWAWFKDLKIPTDELYERLKQKGVLVIPGKYFFYGLDEPWKHQQACIRMTYSQDNKTVEQGIKIIGEVLRSLY